MVQLVVLQHSRFLKKAVSEQIREEEIGDTCDVAAALAVGESMLRSEVASGVLPVAQVARIGWF